MTDAPPPVQKRKLIEVALPLEVINRESAREKSIRHGHPSTLHLWWARRPLATARAVLFAQLVDDPSSHPDRFPTEADVITERKRLHDLMERLVVWENSDDKDLFRQAHQEILNSTGGNPPPILDPFAGGGTIPLEAQRLGLEAHASDLNPVAVLINKALIEIPPEFAGQPPAHPNSRSMKDGSWPGATGLAEDVSQYAHWVRDEAFKLLGTAYPKVSVGDGTKANVIAWLWARTVTCPNPACGKQAPLVNSFSASKKKGREAHVVPVSGPGELTYRVEFTSSPSTAATVTRSGATCVSCGTAIPFQFIRTEGRADRLGRHLLCAVAEGNRRRYYLAPTDAQVEAADVEPAANAPHEPLPLKALGFRIQAYGIDSHDKLYTSRQQQLLTTLVALIGKARNRCFRDSGSLARADAVAVYLALWLGRIANRASSQSFWHANGEKVEQVFGRNAMPMIWVYAESNPFSTSSGNIIGQLDYLTKTLAALPANGTGVVHQQDAAQLAQRDIVYSTDPPYYDNVPYADLSDFFYVWHRRVLHDVLPDLYSTLLTPKGPELIAEPARAGSWTAAASFFEQGLRRVFDRMTADNAVDFPFTIYYAFKQSETDDDGTASTGWETMLQALVDSGAMITATWPVRTELAGGLRELGRNALATSVVLACRSRAETSGRTDRRGLIAALDAGLPGRLQKLQQSRISPVDLEQAAIGPGMAIFTSFASVLNDDGTPMRVRNALQLINRVIDSVLRQEDADYDDDTKFAVLLFRHFGLETGPFGDADGFARKMTSSLDHLERAGILTKRANRVKLLGPADLDPNWDPSNTPFLSEWSVVMQLARALSDTGVIGASALLMKVPATVDRDLCKELAFLIFKLAGDLKQTKVALEFNALGTAWNDIAADVGPSAEQGTFDYTGD